MSRLFIDVETRSRQDLKKTGVYRYVRCPDFKILMASWSLDGSPVRTALSEEAIQGIPGLWEPDVVKVAHNAPFERICFSEFARTLLAWRPDEPMWFIQPEQYHDTQAVAAEYGYPQKLEKLAPALGAVEKDAAGTRLINLFCKPRRDGGWNDEATHPLEWLDFIAYCEQDVETLIDVDTRLGDFPTEAERRTYYADQYINDRGIAIDPRLARLAMANASANAEWQKARVRELAGVDNPGSQPQMMAWIKDQKLPAKNLQKATVDRLLAGDLSPAQREVLELRQELALAAPAKFGTALGSVLEDGRLRGTLRFFGAHTGRWSGRGTQVQNLPRAAFTNDADVELAVLDLHDGEQLSSLELKQLIRPMFLVNGVVVDYAAIEARVLAWLADERWALDAFNAGRDIYVETAERMGGLSRAQGKIAVLALGYNGGINSLKALAGDRDALVNIAKPPGVAMPTGGVRLVNDWMTDEEIDERLTLLVRQWRRANPSITQLWATMNNAVGDEGAVGPRLSISRVGDTVRLHLPSGRAIHYHGMRWERYRVVDPVTERLVAKEGWRFRDPARAGARVGTYGGRLVENATQAVARDILAEALVRLEDRGYRVVGHVHDEILVEGASSVEEVEKIMSEPPDWAAGLPIDGEGFVTARYRKG